MTREEHIKWCKERAIQEYDYYIKTEPHSALKNGITSMMSNINKHEETKSEALQSLCIFQLMTKPNMSRQEFVNFINGIQLMSYYEDKYIDYLAEKDGAIGGDAWRDDFNPRVALEKHMSESKYENVKCPKCDGEMVSRTGKFGVFWGCKDYPNCKGTRDSQGRSKADRAAERESKEESDIDRAQGRTTFNRKKE